MKKACMFFCGKNCGILVYLAKYSIHCKNRDVFITQAQCDLHPRSKSHKGCAIDIGAKCGTITHRCV